jgi:predicted ABC-type ATPase
MPRLYIIAGPNGAGKSTASKKILPYLKCDEFVNADVIASGLSAFNSEAAAFSSGRIMLERIKYLAENKIDFAFETTLAAKSFLPFVLHCRENGYKIILIYFFLRNIKTALERVDNRVTLGGHSIPHETIKRRFSRSLHNLMNLYLPVADEWIIFDNTFENPKSIAENEEIFDKNLWARILKYKS